MGTTIDSGLPDQLRSIAGVLENFSDGFMMLDSQWRTVYMNVPAERLLELPRETVEGHVLWDALDDVSVSLIEAELRKAMADQEPSLFEAYCPRLDRWLSVAAYPINDGLGVYFRDISDRRKSQEALRESEAQFRNMVENLPAGAVFREGDQLWLNRAAERLIGYRQQEVGTIDEWFRKLHPHETAASRKRYDKLRNNRFPKKELSKLICKDGSVRQVEFTGYLDDRSEFWLLHDITDRLTTEQKFRLLFDHSNTALFLFENNLISDCNVEALRQLGYSEKGEVVGRSFSSIAPERQADGVTSVDRLITVNRELNDIGKSNFEWICLKADGTTASVYVSAAKFPVGDETLELVVWQDLTEIKDAEKRLRESEALYRTILENTDEIVYTLSLDGKFTFVSPSWTKHLGHSVSEVVGHRFIEFVHPEDREAGLQYTLKLYKDPTYRGSCQYRAIHQDGTVRWHETSGSTVQDETGKVLYFVGHSNDISERMQARAALVEARDSALAGSLAKSQFLATVSHEIRTPLNGVLGMTNLLADTVLSTEQQSFVRTIQASGEILSRVIDDVLDFSRLEVGKLTISPLAIDVIANIQDVVSLFQGRAQEKGIALGLDCDGIDALMVYADPARVKQVVANLVGNAVKFTEAGGVQVSVKIAKNAPTAVILRIEVADTGIGISADQAGAIFDDFTQGDNRMNRKYGGSGLGLTISKRLTDLMGGNIGVESQDGSGSKFWVELPLSKINRSASKAKDAEVEVSLEGVRVLLAEDNIINVEVARRQIERFGCMVEVAENGEQAVEMSAQNEYQVILMDVQMPKMDGLEATRTIRAREAGNDRHIPIIALTATAFAEDKRACEEAGMDAFLPKPFKLGDLESMLKRWVSAP